MLVRWAMRRIFRDIPVWVQVVLVGALLAYWGWHAFLRMPAGGSLIGHTHIERPIYSFWVNNNWGGNLSAYQGGATSGGVTCCWSFEGDTAEVVWILSMSRKQQQQGMVKERHSVTLTMPERTREDRYLHVHFLPNNKVKLGWSPDFLSPFEEYPDYRWTGND